MNIILVSSLNLDQLHQTEVDSYGPREVRPNSAMNNGIRYITLQKTNDNQSFGFVIISSQNKSGVIVGKLKHSPIENCVFRTDF